ncbi:MAG: hypothetical protein ACREQ8_05595 [Woeseiaceae bacterium]
MSRTYRRRRQRHDYDWVLRDYRCYDPVFEVRHRHNANWSWW